MKRILKVLLVIFVLFTLSACGGKTILTDNEIKDKLTEMGFDVNEITDSIEDSNISIVRTANNRTYQIEYYVFKNDESAKLAFENNMKMFKANKKYKGKLKSAENYDKYIQETNDYYNVVSRNKNILIYVSVNIDNKKDIKKVLNELGY